VTVTTLKPAPFRRFRWYWVFSSLVLMTTQLPVHYARGSLYSDSSSTTLAHPVPQIAQFMPNNSALTDKFTNQNAAQPIYSLVIELMDPNTRESALLELSKKREQYDDLALVLWHSFGASCLENCNIESQPLFCRNHAGAAAGDCLRLSSSLSAQFDCARIEPRMQCSCPSPMCCVTLGDPATLSKWCGPP
jgi:hypothetical protein